MPAQLLYVIDGNIPASFRSADLRNYFSNFVEKGYFNCFHYRHRPEQLRETRGQASRLVDSVRDTTATARNTSSSLSGVKGGAARSRCCVVAVLSEFEKDFMKMYCKKNWSELDGGLLAAKVCISKLSVEESELNSEAESETAKQSRKETSDPDGVIATCNSSIPLRDLLTLPEMTPPSVMPQGNVGTPLSTFMELIRTCKLPAYIIKKLQLEFPRSRSSKRYGAVSFDYRTHVGECSSSTEEGDYNKSVEEGDRTSGDESDIPSDDDHDAEEWERYEAFHDDADKQGRSKERLYEEDLEVMWEKGGSGLVFYTDASYWDQQDGDFDEKCSQEDDWDVDMSVYYDHAGGNKDARDMRDMEMERRLRDGEDSQPWKELGGFEKHTKGIGSKLLKCSGWTVGSGVGATNQGLIEPVEAEGQLPFIKRGLGYQGEKIDRHVPLSKRKRKQMKDVIISTVYDRQEEEENTVLRTAPPTILKHREIQFIGGGLLKPADTSDNINRK